MKKIFALSAVLFVATALFAQDTSFVPAPKKPTINLASRPNDHLLLQIGYAGWAGIADSIKPEGFSKSFNMYFMFDFPFKTNPRLSMAFGPGIATDHIVFKSTHVGIKDITSALVIDDRSDTVHFKKTKVATAYLEAPVEFRYTANPANAGKSFKFALGVKVGLLLNAHTRNAVLQDKNNSTLNDYVMKESSKRFFNKNRISGMARIGYGHFTLFGSYQFTTLFKHGAGPEVSLFSIGLTLSGL